MTADAAPPHPPVQEFRYDEGWAARLALVRASIAAGERNPRRLIAMLRRRDRHLILWNRVREGGTHWMRRKVEAGAETWPTGLQAWQLTSYKGNFLKVPTYADFQIAALLAELAEIYGPFDVIVELGCGYGRNLFEMIDQYDDDRVRYVGGELAPSGIELAREIAALHEAGDRFSFAPFDHMQPDFSLIGAAQRVLILTVHSIEQVHRLPTDYFHRLAGAAPEVVGIHIEPFGFQVNPTLGPATVEQIKFFTTRRWNNNMHRVLRRAEADGALVVDHVALECFLPADAINQSSLAIWHRTAR